MVLLASTSRGALPVRRGSALARRFDVAIIGGGHNGLVAVSSAVCARVRSCESCSSLHTLLLLYIGCVFAEGGEKGCGTGEETSPWRSGRDGRSHPRLVPS